MKCKIKFTRIVFRFLADDLKLYGPFQPGDRVVLPVKIADVFLLSSKAEVVKNEN